MMTLERMTEYRVVRYDGGLPTTHATRQDADAALCDLARAGVPGRLYRLSFRQGQRPIRFLDDETVNGEVYSHLPEFPMAEREAFHSQMEHAIR